jgi:hypothetical protein
MIGKKIGTYFDFFKGSRNVNRLTLKALFEKEKFQMLAAQNLSLEDLKEFAPGVKFEEAVNSISMEYNRDKFVIKFLIFKKPKVPVKDQKFAGFFNTSKTLAIDLKTLDVYNSEY